MKKKILSLALILMLVGAMFVLTGCGSDNYSDTILEVKDGYFENSFNSIITQYTIGEMMDLVLDDTTWKEEKLDYYNCVAVEGTKKDSGEIYKIYFYLGQLDIGDGTYPYYAIYIDGEQQSDSEFNSFLTEISEEIIAGNVQNYMNSYSN